MLDTDRIFVFDEGRVVETGDYDELVSRGGVFTELVHSAAGEAPSPTPTRVAPIPVTMTFSEPSGGIEMHSIFDVTAHGEPVKVG